MQRKKRHNRACESFGKHHLKSWQLNACLVSGTLGKCLTGQGAALEVFELPSCSDWLRGGTCESAQVRPSTPLGAVFLSSSSEPEPPAQVTIAAVAEGLTLASKEARAVVRLVPCGSYSEMDA